MKTDYNKVAKYEKAISEKYGKEAIENPKKHWNQEKEKEYLVQMKAFYKEVEERRKKSEEKEVNGIRITGNIAARNVNRECPVCSVYSFSSKDDLYMNRYQCCFGCYIQYVEGREARWSSGWRPEID
jgi:hypothetical protein